MGALYLLDLPDVLRAAGLTVVEVDGWQTRARSSGGFEPGRPTAIMIHHTASKPGSDGERDVDYIINGSSVAPISQLYTSRTGVVYVCAAGATNTNGKGVDTWGGGVPVDRMNEFAISNEIANDGIGEPYPIAQQHAVLTTTVACARHYRIMSKCVRGHFEWTTRKIDPSGPSKWAPAGGRWDMAAFRADVAAALTAPPTPTPEPKESIDMILIKYDRGGGAWTGLTYTGAHLAHVTTSDAWSIPVAAGAQVVDVNDAQLDALIRSAQTTNACPPEWVGTARGAAWTAQRG